ncbi:hypothetical protein HELRODRAFT_164176 [Helobdella robusta]|uniref:Uncharacterized protein n=1 Tax=Helobdella robusta TaxID=6412 RepID=T1EV16_HELRO|nr:hypothetical protein HELRODRAFT_164176 [Helobdella robusta]ESN94346.1 hypothetical protein HELRODRAFT_164176 [Helobdella robusta]
MSNVYAFNFIELRKIIKQGVKRETRTTNSTLRWPNNAHGYIVHVLRRNSYQKTQDFYVNTVDKITSVLVAFSFQHMNSTSLRSHHTAPPKYEFNGLFQSDVYKQHKHTNFVQLTTSYFLILSMLHWKNIVSRWTYVGQHGHLCILDKLFL